MQSRVMPENCGTSSGRQCGLSSGLLPTMETDLPFPMPGECPRLETGRGTSAIASGATYADETAGGEGGQCRSKLQAIGKSTSAPMHISVRRPMRFIAPLFEPIASQSGSGSVRNFSRRCQLPPSMVAWRESQQFAKARRRLSIRGRQTLSPLRAGWARRLSIALLAETRRE